MDVCEVLRDVRIDRDEMQFEPQLWSSARITANPDVTQIWCRPMRGSLGSQHDRVIANQDGSVYSTRCSAAYAVYREDQWQRRSKHTELES